VTPTGGPEDGGCNAARRSTASAPTLAAFFGIAFVLVRRRRQR
jgi:hypothetical protein